MYGSSLSTFKRPPQAPGPRPEGLAISICAMSFTSKRLPDQHVKANPRLLSILWLQTPQDSTAFHAFEFFDGESKRLAGGSKGRTPGPEPDLGSL
jgi:hypothetical protein